MMQQNQKGGEVDSVRHLFNILHCEDWAGVDAFSCIIWVRNDHFITFANMSSHYDGGKRGRAIMDGRMNPKAFVLFFCYFLAWRDNSASFRGYRLAELRPPAC